eukprot:NODE_4116_length_1227_cov_28.523551_g3620_i0.p1 GENE.NODE_4116_length_1227_cov_28.523551_g3620_i0~~NODE_4116_length_1227_cov_28.523551_g3620_i0.p1  ORF type:complete len:344 (-),score=94.44 NODE_4116_length_1227_cov_28.523551_g3620_i0:109-1140(-)
MRRKGGEIAALRQEIADLEQETRIPKEDYYAKCFSALQEEVERANGSFFDERQRKLIAEELQGQTMCIKMGRSGKCRFINGKCLHCSRDESSFKVSYSLHSWRNEEERLWDEEKNKQRKVMEDEFKRERDLIDIQRNQLNEERAQFNKFKEEIEIQIKLEREEIKNEKMALEKEKELNKSDIVKQRQDLINERQKLENEIGQWADQQKDKRKQVKSQMDQLQNEVKEWQVFKYNELEEINQKKSDLEKAIEIHKQELESFAQEVASFEEERRIQLEKEQQWEQQCEEWIQSEQASFALNQQIAEEMLARHKSTWISYTWKQLKNAVLEGREFNDIQPLCLPPE